MPYKSRRHHIVSCHKLLSTTKLFRNSYVYLSGLEKIRWRREKTLIRPVRHGYTDLAIQSSLTLRAHFAKRKAHAVYGQRQAA